MSLGVAGLHHLLPLLFACPLIVNIAHLAALRWRQGGEIGVQQRVLPWPAVS
jgi:hypothetical protein